MKLYFCFLLTLTKVLTSQVYLDNVMIETIDITVDEYIDNNNNTIQNKIEAFKSTNNDQIIKNNQTNRYGELEWHSIGSPFLANIHSKNSSLSFDNLFQITPNGFNIYIQFLNDVQKRAIIESIKIKYGIDVHSSRIIKLMLSELTCSIDLYCDNQISEESIKLNGSSKVSSKFPIKVEFKNLDRKTMTCFDQYLVEHQQVDIHCIASRNLKKKKNNNISISAENINNEQAKSFNIEYKDEAIKYQRLPNQMVNKNSSIKILKQIKSVKTLWSCLKMCENNNRCQYSEYHDSSQECYLYNKIAHFHLLTSNKSIQVNLYKRMIYFPKELQGVKIINNHFMRIEDVADSDSCWEGCLKQEKCHMVNYKIDNGECYLFEELSYSKSIQIIEDQDYITVCYEKEDRFKLNNNTTISMKTTIARQTTMTSKKKEQVQVRDQIDHSKYTRYNKTQISGLYLSLNMESEESCLKECIRRKNVCIAISFGDENRCHLVKKGEYQHRRFNDWVSIYLENQAPIISENMNSTYTAKRTLSGHEYSAMSLAILHNGDLVSGSTYKTIKIWNSTDGTLKQTLNSHGDSVDSLVVLHNGNLVSGSRDNTIKIWNSETYQVERTLTNHTNWVKCLTVFPNTDFASGSRDNTIIIWSSNGDYKRTLHGHTDWVNSLVVLPSGKLASGSNDESIKIWSADGNLEKTLTGHSWWVYSLAVLDNGYLASGSWDKTAKIWNENGELIYTHQYDSFVYSLAVLPNGDLLIGTYFENILIGIIRIKDKNKLDSQEVKSVLFGYSSLMHSFAVFSNGDFASASFDETIIIWSQN